MSAKFIEVTEVVVTQGGAGGDKTKLIGVAHIVSIVGGGLHNTSGITLDHGKTISVRETYDELKQKAQRCLEVRMMPAEMALRCEEFRKELDSLKGKALPFVAGSAG